MDDSDWSRIILRVVAGCGEDEDEARELIAYIVAQVRRDEVTFEEVAEEEPEADEDDEVPLAPTLAEVSKRPPRAEIGTSTAQAIRVSRFRDALTYAEIEQRFKVSKTSIQKIVRRESYSGLPLVEGEAGFEDEEEARARRVQMRRDRAADALEPTTLPSGGRSAFANERKRDLEAV